MVDLCIFFFKQKTAYEMRISDWSSDVCSSGLAEIQIAAARRFTKGLRTNEVRGTMTVKEALSKLLAGTGLTVRSTGQRTYMVVPSPVRSTAEELTFTGEPLAAQDEQIVVTGSRIRGGQTTSPITTISRRDAERAGQTDLGQVIRDLPQNFSGGQNPPIAPTGQGSFSNVSGSSTLNLRGLGPAASLTLLCGHRFAFAAMIGRAHVETPVTNAHLVRRFPPEKLNQ